MFAHLRALTTLTLSTFVSRVGLHLLIVVDALAVGRYAVEQLAWYGAAAAIGSILYVLAPGLLIGCLVQTSGARARKTPQAIGDIWRAGVLYGVAAGVIGGLFCLTGPALLSALGQEPAVAAGGGHLLAWFGLGLPLHFAGFATLYVLEGAGRARACAIVLATAAAGNFGLNLLLVFEETAGLGADGALAGTVMIRGAVFAVLATLLFTGREAEAYGLRRWRWPALRVWRSIWSIGFAGGASLAGESTAFASLTIFAGWLGASALAVYTILFNVLSTIFMMALAFGVATSVQVAWAREHEPQNGPKQALQAALILSTALMGGFGLLAWGFAGAVTAVFTEDAGTAALAAGLMGWLVIFLLADGTQVTIHHAVRGLNDGWVTTAINLSCYLGVMTTLSWALAIPAGQGVAGLFQGGLIASVLVAGLLIWRFEALRQRAS